MNTYLGLYLLTRLNSIYAFAVTFSIFSTILTIVLFVVWITTVDRESSTSSWDNCIASKTRATIKTIWKSLLPIMIFLWMIVVLIPTQKQAIFIVAGGKTLNWAIQDSSLTKLPSQSTQLMSSFLEQQISSLTKDINNEADSVKVGLKDMKDSVSKEIKTAKKSLISL